MDWDLQLEKQFKEKLKAQEGKFCVQAAVGYVVGELKESYEEIVKRADGKMYDHKQEKKEAKIAKFCKRISKQVAYIVFLIRKLLTNEIRCHGGVCQDTDFLLCTACGLA